MECERNSALVFALEHYTTTDAKELEDREFILNFVKERDEPFSRNHLDGHLTASAFIINADRRSTILGHHRKLDKWLQVGGHGEPGDTCPRSVALREALEETAISGLTLHPDAQRPFDIDVHQIPTHGNVPAHKHLDIRFLFIAPPGSVPCHRPEEHMALKWVEWNEAFQLDIDHGLRRALRKAMHLADVVNPTA